MNFETSDEQRLLCESARKFFVRECPLARVRDYESRGLDAFLPLYRKMGEVGYLGIGVPEQAGGSGGDWIDLALFAEEAGRALVPTLQITSVVLAGQALLALGDEAQQRARLPALIAGESVMAPAWIEGAEADRAPDQRTRATPDGDAMRLDGIKRHVEGYEAASELLVSASGQAGAPCFLLVPRASAGIESEAAVRSSLERVHQLRFGGVKVGRDGMLRGDWSAWLRVLDRAKVIAAAWATGAARAALDMAVAYAKERKQFGRPIGSFQAVQHRLADAGIALEQATAMVRYAAWLCGTPADCAREAAMAKLVAGRAVRQITHAATLTHGGYGFMEEFDIQLYFRRAKQFEHAVEGPVLQRELIAAEESEDLRRIV